MRRPSPRPNSTNGLLGGLSGLEADYFGDAGSVVLDGDGVGAGDVVGATSDQWETRSGHATR